MAAAASRNDKLKEELESARRAVSRQAAPFPQTSQSPTPSAFRAARQGALRRDRGGELEAGS